jgi:hypothetical protein
MIEEVVTADWRSTPVTVVWNDDMRFDAMARILRETESVRVEPLIDGSVRKTRTGERRVTGYVRFQDSVLHKLRAEDITMYLGGNYVTLFINPDVELRGEFEEAVVPWTDELWFKGERIFKP